MKRPAVQAEVASDKSLLIERARSAQVTAVLTSHRSGHLIDQIQMLTTGGGHHDLHLTCSEALQAVMKQCVAAQVELVRARAQWSWFEHEQQTTARKLAKADDEIALLRRQLETQTGMVRELEMELAATYHAMADLNAELQDLT